MKIEGFFIAFILVLLSWATSKNENLVVIYVIAETLLDSKNYSLNS